MQSNGCLQGPCIRATPTEGGGVLAPGSCWWRQLEWGRSLKSSGLLAARAGFLVSFHFVPWTIRSEISSLPELAWWCPTLEGALPESSLVNLPASG